MSSLGFDMLIDEDVKWADEQLRVVGGVVRFSTDDGYLVGPPDIAIRIANEMAQRIEARCGLHLNRTKSKVFYQDVTAARHAVTTSPGRGFTLGHLRGVCPATAADGFGIMVVGIPVGDDRFVAKSMTTKTSTILEGFNKIISTLRLVSSMSLMAMCTYCCIPMLNYWMQIMDPDDMLEHCNRLDDGIRQMIRSGTLVNLHPDHIDDITRRRT